MIKNGGRALRLEQSRRPSASARESKGAQVTVISPLACSSRSAQPQTKITKLSFPTRQNPAIVKIIF